MQNDTTLSVNHTNCLEQGTFRHTYGNVIHSIRLHLNSPSFHFQPFIRTESVHGECSGNHVLITHWPFDPRAALILTVQPDSTAWGCKRLQHCVWLLEDDASQWNLNCGACECIVFISRLHLWVTLNCRGGQPVQLGQRLSVSHGTSVTTSAGLKYPDCKWAAVN